MARLSDDFCVAAAVNDREILAACLARSPDILSGRLKLMTYEGYSSAAAALNAGLDGSTAPFVILAHQDVYLPRPWLDNLIAQIEQIERKHENWGVLGLFGRKITGEWIGRVWSSGLGHEAGEGGFSPAEAATVDELLLVVRRASGLRFDENLPGFHLYGTDIVTEGRARGIPSFVIDAPVVHNSKPVKTLKGAYAQAYRYMQRKWRKRLPVPTLICDIEPHPIALWRAQLQSMKIYRRNVARPRRDAVEIAKALNYE
ncbi:glycosyltransferase [Phenylobacterium koreense]|uniref:Glycosyltransferase n=1 Tax=Phenylobacterium koreense TaxID=266125 RepID=A0ABV2EM46_9CAUL